MTAASKAVVSTFLGVSATVSGLVVTVGLPDAKYPLLDTKWIPLSTPEAGRRDAAPVRRRDLQDALEEAGLEDE